jgi:hypothetical protein
MQTNALLAWQSSMMQKVGVTHGHQLTTANDALHAAQAEAEVEKEVLQGSISHESK